MEAVLRNGGIKVDGTVNNVSNFVNIKLHILNMYLNAIGDSTDAESLRIESSRVELVVNRLKIVNPYTSGFTEKGFVIIEDATQKEIVFVECETDIEI